MRILFCNDNLFYGLWQLFMIRKIDSSTCQMNSHLLQHGFNVALLLIAACGGGGGGGGGAAEHCCAALLACRRGGGNNLTIRASFCRCSSHVMTNFQQVPVTPSKLTRRTTTV